MKNTKKFIFTSLFLLIANIIFANQVFETQNDTIKLKKDQKSEAAADKSIKKESKTQVKEVKSVKPDMSKAKGARPPLIRPKGAHMPLGAGKPKGVAKRVGR